MQDTVTIRILRSAYIETNSDVALIRLDTMEHKEGQPVMIGYYNTDGDVEYIVALGTKLGVGRDCYSVISTSKEEVINGVVYSLPDISELVNDAIYICKYDGVWSKVLVWTPEEDEGDGEEEATEEDIVPLEEEEEATTVEKRKRVIPLDVTKSKIFKDISTGFRWFWSSGELFREDDFMPRQEVQDKFDKIRLEKIFTVKSEFDSIQPKGTEIKKPVLKIKIMEGAVDVTSMYNFNVVSDIRGKEKINTISGNTMILEDSINTTVIYTITATEKESGETLTATCEVAFVPYTLYTTSYSTSISTTTVRNAKTALWDGVSDLKLEFNMDSSTPVYSVILIPNIFKTPDKILDKHGIDYIDNYNVGTLVYNNENYKILTKKDAVSMSGPFKQILGYE